MGNNHWDYSLNRGSAEKFWEMVQRDVDRMGKMMEEQYAYDFPLGPEYPPFEDWECTW